MYEVSAVILEHPIKLGAIVSEPVVLEAVMHNVIVVTGGYPKYKGDYIVAPKAFTSTTLDTKNKVLSKDVTVLEIPYFDVSNESGTTIYIGSEVNLNGN